MNKEANLTIRRATVDDASLLADLGARTFYETFAVDNTPEDFLSGHDRQIEKALEVLRAEMK